MAKKKTAGRRKKIPLAEFKAWLEGVEELQSDEWSPDQTQWALIRTKIDSIIEVAPPAPQAAQQPIPQQPPQMLRPGFAPQQMPPQMVPQQPIGQDGQPIAVPMVGDATPPAVPTDNPMLNPTSSPGGVGAPVTKTPEIDTSSGSYGSSFA